MHFYVKSIILIRKYMHFDNHVPCTMTSFFPITLSDGFNSQIIAIHDLMFLNVEFLQIHNDLVVAVVAAFVVDLRSR